MRPIRDLAHAAAALTAVALLSTAGGFAAAEEFELTARLDATTLEFHNLIGEIRIEGHDGDGFEVVVRVGGRDASRDRVRLDRDDGRVARLRVEFPLDESRRYVYPGLGRLDVEIRSTEGRVGWLSSLLRLGRRDVVEIHDAGRGLEIRADTTIRVPRDAELIVRHGAGRIAADGVRGRLDLDSHAGPVDVSRITGSVVIDTGSGAVSVDRCDTDELAIDTGSGRVDIVEVATGRLHVDTGSGSVSARAVSAETILIDTGSGSVELDLDTLDRGDHEIDTGSGAVSVALPRDSSVDIRVDTGSGGIEIDLDQLHDVDRSDDDEARVIVGDGRARLVIDTGSGRIRLSERG